MQEGQQEEVTKTITHKRAKMTAAEEEEDSLKIRRNPAMQRIYEEKARIKEEEAKEKAAKDAQKALEDAKDEKGQAPNLGKERKANERFTDGMVAESFTSTATPLRVQNELRLMTDEEDLQEVYNEVKTKKAKAYVRLITSEGMLNIELHTNIVPRTCDNFLRLCEKDYYNDTIFHRLIQNFMMQGGDPTNTGRGGQSAFEGGKAFKDEFDSRLSHQGPGIISMANNGKNTNKSQFFVTLKSCQHLDNKHSVFGRVVGGLQLLDAFNKWETGQWDDGSTHKAMVQDKPIKDIKLLRTEVFKNPFKEAVIEMAKPKVEKVVDPVATWFSNRRDPMEEHKNRNSASVGKYLDEPPPPLPGQAKRKPDEVPREELEYATVPHKAKRVRTSFDFSAF
jgi:peptidyl-prolyl cis-trans isomerase-like protein 2